MGLREDSQVSSQDNKFAENKKPLDDHELSHLILQALGKIGHNPEDTEKFLKRLQHVDFGLSAEHECAAVLAWLGNCVMAHGLDQDGYMAVSLGEVQIPDLLVVFRQAEVQFSALIEVKCTHNLRIAWGREIP
jgi:hypothetical protein